MTAARATSKRRCRRAGTSFCYSIALILEKRPGTLDSRGLSSRLVLSGSKKATRGSLEAQSIAYFLRGKKTRPRGSIESLVTFVREYTYIYIHINMNVRICICTYRLRCRMETREKGMKSSGQSTHSSRQNEILSTNLAEYARPKRVREACFFSHGKKEGTRLFRPDRLADCFGPRFEARNRDRFIPGII